MDLKARTKLYEFLVTPALGWLWLCAQLINAHPHVTLYIVGDPDGLENQS